MTNLGITHLAIWQANIQAASGDQAPGLCLPEVIPDRCASLGDGIVFRLSSVTPSVEDDENRGGGFAHEFDTCEATGNFTACGMGVE